MANFSSFDPASITPESIRVSWLQKGFSLRSVARVLLVRVRFCRALSRRFDLAVELREQRFLDFLYQSWLLAENLCTLFELLYDPDAKDIRSDDARKSTPGDAAGRQMKRLTSFFKRAAAEEVWARYLGNEQYLRERGFVVEDGRRVIGNLLLRNRNALLGEYTLVREFLARYRDLCNAYKHGRAIFSLSHSVTRSEAPDGTRTLHFERSAERFLAVSIDDGDDVTSVTEMIVDDEEIRSVNRSSEKACAQVVRLADQIIVTVGSLEGYLAVLEGRSEQHELPMPAFPLFIETPTAEELRLLSSPAPMGPAGAAHSDGLQ